MAYSESPLHCPNFSCQAPNRQSDRFCVKCSTPLSKLYLWGLGEKVTHYSRGDLIANRYLLVNPRILLDTKPALLPEVPTTIPDAIQPYLRLSAYSLHIPQPYGWIYLAELRDRAPIWLLEQVPIFSGGRGSPDAGQLMPDLLQLWPRSSPLRQLNWLWQMAYLWQPLQAQGVASSLLNPELLKVEGSIVRLLQLEADQHAVISLQSLGQLWARWQSGVDPSLQEFFRQLVDRLIRQEITSPEQLLGVLERALGEVGRSHRCTLQIATASDKGPRRAQNEDACYPPSGSALSSDQVDGTGQAYAIVCDGIGGHDGGEVASQLAIDTIHPALRSLSIPASEPANLIYSLEQAACAANDQISQRNDQEQRLERQRMGTTLVMAVAQGMELYITHVGDSRAYRISPTSCQQITLDDDIASREVRLGYAFYRDALQQMGAGSLVQALGMGNSQNLYPTVQRLILDEDCVVLLCSDGLSDNDRVEQYWETELLPILEGTIDVSTAAKRLVQLANTTNGHDNVTVAVIHCRVPSSKDETVIQPSQPDLAPLPLSSGSISGLRTQFVPPPRRRGPGLALAGLLGLGVLAGLAYLYFPTLKALISPAVPVASQAPPLATPIPAPVPSQAAIPAASPADSLPPLTVGVVFQLLAPVQLQLTPGTANSPTPTPSQLPNNARQVPSGTVLKVLRNQKFADRSLHLQLEVCSLPSGSSGDSASKVTVGEKGWIEPAKLLTQYRPLETTVCGTAPRSISPTN